MAVKAMCRILQSFYPLIENASQIPLGEGALSLVENNPAVQDHDHFHLSSQ
jgi:hypothetical protein